MSNVILRTPADVPGVVAGLLGFYPTDSLVIVGSNGGPTARVDIVNDHAAIVHALAPAFHQWRDPVVVAIYTADEAQVRTLTALLNVLPMPIALICQVVAGHVRVGEGEWIEPTPVPPEFGPCRIEPDRQSLVDDAETCTDAEEAWIVAEAAWQTGHGARAWCWLDRYVALNGEDARSRDLAAKMYGAVNPRKAAEQ